MCISLDPFVPLDGEQLLQRLGPQVHCLRGRLVPHMEMRTLTWFRTGGMAELFFQPEDEDDLSLFLKILPPDVPLTLVGMGTNLLIRDGGIKGVVLRLAPKAFGNIRLIDASLIEVGCGASDKRLAAFARESGVGGLHFYHGIPGGVGGALRMNAGANGLETAQAVVKVYAMDRQGVRHILDAEQMGYSYRHSSAPQDLIFLKAILKGTSMSRSDIDSAMQAVIEHREKAQPVREKTGGSTFRNPEEISAWCAIDKAGCRGLCIGGAQMSELHCNFMINTGNASAYDLEFLGETVRARVLHTLGIRLQWEIKRLGQFSPDKAVLPFLEQKYSAA